MKKQIFIFIIVAVLLVVGSFYGGFKYGQDKKTSLGNPAMQGVNNFLGNGQNRMGNRTNGGMNSGEIMSKDDSSITLKLRDGGSKIIFFSDSTEFLKMSTGSVQDFSVGDNIVVSGTANSDGSITAQSIQLRSTDMPMPTGAAPVPTTEQAETNK